MANDDFFDGLDEVKERLGPKAAGALASGEGALGDKVDERWRVLYEISQLFNSPIYDFEEILEIILDMAIQITRADRGFLMLYDEHDRLEVKLAKNMTYESLPPDEREVSRSITEAVIRSEKGSFVSNVETDPRFSQLSSIIKLKIMSAMCAPLKITLRDERGALKDHRSIVQLTTRKILGVIYVDSQAVTTSFTEADLDLFQALANNATTAILNASLYQQATADERTNLFTRRHFEQRLKDEIKLARKSGSDLSLLMADLDNLKRINETHGYDVGDVVLGQIGRLMATRTRGIDVCARYGGDEFAVILPQTDVVGAESVAKKILDAMEEETFLEGREKITLSAGLGWLQEGDDAAMLVKRADQALYKAKQDGGGCWRTFSAELADTAKRTDKLAGVFSGDPARDYRNVLMLLETISSIGSTFNLEQLLPLVIDTIIDVTHADRGILLLRNDETGMIEPRLARDRNKATVEPQEYSRSVVDKVVQGDNAVRMEDIETGGPRVESSHSIQRLELRAVMCVPLTVVEKTAGRRATIGAIYVDSQRTSEGFDEAGLAFFDTLAAQVAQAIDNARLYRRVEVLNKALENKLEVRERELDEVRADLEAKTREIELKYDYEKIVGKSAKMIQVFQLLDRITDTPVPVFIHGESGTGKELVAKAIHYNGPRRKATMVSENCAAMSETLLESELFGYVRGAFTGAQADRKGLFEIATGGTLFLDEVGDMSLSMQKKLLRVLQEGEVRRVGGKDMIKIDVRIISASNKDLKRLTEDGKFREDLYYRLNVVKIDLPALRERKEDIPLLADYFLKEDVDGPIKRLDVEAMNMLLRYHWPGNIRELKNVIERGKIICEGEVITKDAVILDAIADSPDRDPAAAMLAGIGGNRPSVGGGGGGMLGGLPGSIPPPTGGLPSSGTPVRDPAYFNLNERQRKLIEYLKAYGTIRNRDYYEFMNVSKSTGWRDIKDLIDRGIIECHGKGKGSVYTIKQQQA